MERVHLYMIGITVLLLALLLLVGGTLLLHMQEANEKHASPESSYTSFSPDTRSFESFTKTQEQDHATVRAHNALFRGWEARIGEELVRALPAVENNSPQTADTPEDIGALFSNLLGDSALDRLRQHDDTTNTYESLLWFDGFNDARAPRQTSRTAYTPVQEALHTYGNSVAKEIRDFNARESNQVAVLDTFAQSYRTADTSSLKKLTDGYNTLAHTLDALTPPDPVATTHRALVEGYRAVGEGLWRLTDAENDEELMSLMLAYNGVAENVARAHVELVRTLRIYDIVFASHEPGSDFMFTPAFGTALE